MTRTNVMASSRPQTADTATRSGSSRARRRLMILPVVLALAVAPVTPALAASSNAKALSGYGKSQEPNKPNSGTSPSKSTKSPANTAPATTSSTPTTSKAGASTLPFTGFDLRWTVGAGLLLVGAGGSIMVMQRRQRRDTGR
jgi:hypothetical protein